MTGLTAKLFLNKLLDEVNQSVIQLLGLGKAEQILIEDFVRWNMQIIKGKVPRIVTKPPDLKTINGYLKTLKAELDIFLGDNVGVRHTVDALYDEFSAIVAIAVKQGRILLRQSFVQMKRLQFLWPKQGNTY